MNYTILQGDNRLTLKTLADNSIDAIITDPPYGIDFLGKSWDANTGALETYQECLRVLKPGGHILAFSAARTYHHLAVTLEAAGFEIRDQIMWIYSSGFPKSQDVGRQIHKKENGKIANPKIYFPDATNNPVESAGQETAPRCVMCNSSTGPIHKKCSREDCIKPWEKPVADNDWSGWGTALKPAHEPIALARKPIKTSIRENVQKYGTGALNIDATRVPYLDIKDMENAGLNWNKTGYETGGPRFIGSGEENKEVDKPAEKKDNINEQGRFPSNVVGEIEGYQKYFYCPKVSRKERHIGHEAPEAEPLNSPDQVRNHPLWEPSIGTNAHRLKEKIRQVNAKDKIKTGLVDNVVTQATMLADMGGHYIDAPINQNIWLPQTGNIYIHGIKEEYRKWCEVNNKTPNVGNNHPTVKPIELMKYLIKLITPPGGTVLDPFNGSGSTGCAAVELGHTYIGCELDPAYVSIAEKRIAAWYEHTRDPAGEIFE